MGHCHVLLKTQIWCLLEITICKAVTLPHKNQPVFESMIYMWCFLIQLLKRIGSRLERQKWERFSYYHTQ